MKRLRAVARFASNPTVLIRGLQIAHVRVTADARRFSRKRDGPRAISSQGTGPIMTELSEVGGHEHRLRNEEEEDADAKERRHAQQMLRVLPTRAHAVT